MAERRSVTVEGRRVAYIETGKGEGTPLLLLHGGAFDHAALTWRITTEHLGQSRRVVVPDLPGYGESESFGAPHPLSRLVSWLEGFADAVGLGRFDAGGVSMGGGMALLAARRYPERVRRVVASGAYGLMDRATLHPAAYALQRAGAFGLAYAMTGRLRGVAAIGLRASYGMGAVRDVTVDELMAVARDQRERRTFEDFLAAEMTPDGFRTDLRDELPLIDQPVLLIHGTRDPVVPIRHARTALPLLTRGRLLELPTGHWPMRQRPDLFDPALIGFLDAPDADLAEPGGA